MMGGIRESGIRSQKTSDSLKESRCFHRVFHFMSPRFPFLSPFMPKSDREQIAISRLPNPVYTVGRGKGNVVNVIGAECSCLWCEWGLEHTPLFCYISY